MNRSTAIRSLDIAARWVLAGVFLFAAAPKIIAPGEFALAVFRYQIVPYPLVNLMGIYLPWLELWSAMALLFAPKWREASALILLGLLAVFTIAIGISLARGIDIACGCFSTNPEKGHIGALSIARNLGLMALGALILWRERRNRLAPS